MELTHKKANIVELPDAYNSERLNAPEYLLVEYETKHGTVKILAKVETFEWCST